MQADGWQMRANPSSQSRYTLREHQHGLFEEVPNRLQKPRAHRAVDHAMVAAHRHTHAWAHHDLAVLYYRPFLDSADGDDSGLRRIDDRRELVNPEHSEVRDRERCARILLWSQLLLA